MSDTSKEHIDVISKYLWSMGRLATQYSKWSKTVCLTPQEYVDELDICIKGFNTYLETIEFCMNELENMEETI